MTLTFRRAREEDLDRLVDIHAGAFADPRSHQARIRNFTRNPLGELSDLHVLEEAGVVAAHAFRLHPPLRLPAEVLGWATARDDDAAARAATLLDLPPYFSPDPF
ncbi:MAG: hypothetical protein ACRELB_15880 [Polyangiaceae bacterium]